MLRRCGYPRARKVPIALVLASRLDKVLFCASKLGWYRRQESQSLLAVSAPIPMPLHHGTICPHLYVVRALDLAKFDLLIVHHLAPRSSFLANHLKTQVERQIPIHAS